MKHILMKPGFARSAAISTAVLLGLLAVEAQAFHLSRRSGAGWLRDLVAMSRGRDVPWTNGFWAESADYYEQLLSGEHGGRSSQSWLARLRGNRQPEYRWPFEDHDYLIYQPQQNVEAPITEDGPVVTNSQGLIDREHARTGLRGVRRIALLGDSITRGFGVARDQRYQAALEQQLNARVGGSGPDRFEVMNFGVTGYVPTQIYYLATERAPAYHPDVYMMTLTPISIGPTWSDHLIKLVQERRDMRYGFLRTALTDAGVQASDSHRVAQWKLAPYRIRILREILNHLKAQAERQKAQFMVVLLPAVETPGMSRTRFRGIRELVEKAGIPVIDLLDTFDHVDNIETERVAWFDIHPNAAGHRLIAENLYRQLSGQPQLWSALTGQAVTN